MTIIKYKSKEIMFGTYGTFELNDVIDEFNKKFNFHLKIMEVNKNDKKI